ncbi:dTMP kinase [Ectobacillus ponti]|uniref:Thymidylate kinase n=1 Tax=Ectobacillus ponti TaxID=2961894 RepID=A0AA41X910_9BACI|nr:dTMP kinase [Ectobacillus ponti]MCP8970942.1 thymidylate kinase [Ectobacillus ponti]
MHKHNGKSTYICLEGLKGAGKTTIFKYLLEKFEEHGIEFSTVSPTKPAYSGHFIEKVFQYFPTLKNNRIARVFLYAHRSNFAARSAAWDKKLVLGDRSVVTSYATKWSASSWRTWFHIWVINHLENKIKAPDYIIYIDVPQEVRRERIDQRDKERDMDESEDRARQMEEAYFHMMNGSGISRIQHVQWLKVSGEGKREQVCEEVFQLIWDRCQQQ